MPVCVLGKGDRPLVGYRQVMLPSFALVHEGSGMVAGGGGGRGLLGGGGGVR